MATLSVADISINIFSSLLITLYLVKLWLIALKIYYQNVKLG